MLEAKLANGTLVSVAAGWKVLHYLKTDEMSLVPPSVLDPAEIRIRGDKPFAVGIKVGVEGIIGFVREYTGLVINSKRSADDGTGTVAYELVPPPKQPRFVDPHDLLDEYTNNGGGD